MKYNITNTLNPYINYTKWSNNSVRAEMTKK